MKDEPGGGKKARQIPIDRVYATDIDTSLPGWNILYGEWKFNKDGMYTSTTDTFSNGFGRTQINRRVMNRLKNVEKRMKKIEAQFRENANYDYHFESDAYHDH